MSILTVELLIPSLTCDLCRKILHPEGVWNGGGPTPRTLNLHNVGSSPSAVPVFSITGFTQADLESQAMEAGWKQIKVYGRDLRICPACQKAGPEPGFEDRLKRLALCLGMKAIFSAENLLHAKEIAAIALREGEQGL